MLDSSITWVMDGVLVGAVAVFLMFTVWHVVDVGEQAASAFLRYGDSAEFIWLGVVDDPLSCGLFG